MSNFYIFRHGETFVSKNKLDSYGDAELTTGILPEAVPIIKKLGLYLKNIETDINVTSPLKRCIETTKIITQVTGKTFKIDERITEYKNDGGDIDSMEVRIRNFINDFDGHFKNILICSHGYPIAALTQLIRFNSIDPKLLDKYPDPGVLVIIENNKIKYLDFGTSLKQKAESQEQ